MNFRYFQISSLTFASSALEAAHAGLDLDPPTGDPDNFLGTSRAGWVEQGVAFSTDGSSEALAQWPWVAAIGTCSDKPYARVALLKGIDAPAPGTVRVESPMPTPAVGTAGDRIAASEGAGSIPLSLFFEPGNDPVEVKWVASLGVAADLAVTDSQITGTVGFGVLQDDAVDAMRDPVSRAFNELISVDMGCPSSCDSDLASAVLGWFDKDANGLISPDELDNSYFRSLYVGQDLDLTATVDGSPVYWPVHDHEYDYSSMALRIEGVPVEVVP